MKGRCDRVNNITFSWPLIVDEQTEIVKKGNEEAFKNDQSLEQNRKSHSHPCLFLDSPKSNEEHLKRIDTSINQQQQQISTTNVLFKNNLYKSESDRSKQIENGGSIEQQQNTLNQQQQQNNLFQQKQQIEKLQRKCSRLEQLESAYRKIERDYEQMLGSEELKHQFRLLEIENEELRLENINIGQNTLFEEKIKTLENLLFNTQRNAKLTKEHLNSFIFSQQQQQSSSSSSVFGSILTASRIIGGELQKVGKRKAQEYLPVGTEEFINKLNKELDSFLIGPEKPQQNEHLNEDLIFDKLNAGASKLVDFLVIRRSFNVFSNDFDQWSMSETTRDQNKEVSLPTNTMSDENLEQLISLLGDDEDRLDRDFFCESKKEVKVWRQKIVKKRKLTKRPIIQNNFSLEEKTSRISTSDLTKKQDEEEFNLTKPISEEREQKF
ncbi:hypothetical protein Mgra_00003336 [Meloidogyne graminicola]|uniref:Uncharacterized protein n=1 Tax=Meloidogyne graminicola TaxID=189291 RepID=A0A8S9ZUG3_9BILA|nr:hypothetical protein Mgra_00003336 [Meloidogyne graminicola]